MLPVLLGYHVWNTQRAPRTYRIFVNRSFHMSTTTEGVFNGEKKNLLLQR